MSPIRKFLAILPSLSSLLFFFTTIAILFSSANNIANDPGVGWHLATGNYILSKLQIPYFDPFLSNVRPWVSDQWGSDVILSCLYALGGWPALASTIGTIFIISFFIILYQALLKEEILPIPSLVATVAAAKVAQIHYIVRPVVFSFLLFTVFLWLIRSTFIHQEQQKVLPRNCWMLFPLLFLIWCNIHPSFLLGIAILTIWPVSLLVHRLLVPDVEQKDDTWKKAWDSTFITLLSLLATMANPYGYGLHKSIVALSNNAFFMNYHSEWLSPDFDKIESKILEFLVLSLVVMTYFTKQKISRLSTFELLSSLFLLHGGLQAIRMTPYFLIAFAFPWARVLSSIIKANADRFLIRKLPVVDSFELRSSWYWAGVMTCLIMVIGLPQLNLPQWKELPKFGPSAQEFPYTELQYILDHTDVTTTVVAPGSFGGFITFISKGKLKPVIDDRNTLLGEKIYKDFHSAELNAETMREFSESFKAKYLILPKNHNLICSLEHSDWLVKEFTGKVAKVFKMKNDGAQSPG
jgi:hypothetical protein